jgi:hypothetical protein
MSPRHDRSSGLSRAERLPAPRRAHVALLGAWLAYSALARGYFGWKQIEDGRTVCKSPTVSLER